MGNVIGSPEVPVGAFTDFWLKLAEHYRDEPAVLAYGLMNEPHGTNGSWPNAAQAAVDAIRSVDRRHTIMVSGDEYGGAHSWKRVNQDLLLHDPANNLPQFKLLAQ
jgi:endoglucanase